MSAHRLDKDEIENFAGLVTLFRDFSFWSFEQEDRIRVQEVGVHAIASILDQANYKSVKARYGSGIDFRDVCERPSDYSIPTYWGIGFDIWQAFKSIDYYRYQTCEFEGWEQSDAARICLALESHLKNREKAYLGAEWGCPLCFTSSKRI